MKTTREITKDILQAVNQPDNPISLLLEPYLDKVIKDIVIFELIEYQLYLNEEGLITDHDWVYEDEVGKYIMNRWENKK